MAKRRSNGATGGKHRTRRIPYQFPEEFSKLARRLAADRQQPTLWFMLALLLEKAREAGVPEEELPKPPWKESTG